MIDITGQLIKIVVACAASVAGIIEWLKAGMDLFSRKKEDRGPKAVIPWAVLPVAAFGAAACFDGGLVMVLSTWIMVWAFAQLTYPALVKLPAMILEYIKAKTAPKDNAP